MMKIFRIGEYAIGGVIKVRIAGDEVMMSCHDWDTDQMVREISSTDYYELQQALLDWTSSYYTEQILDWLKGQGIKPRYTSFF